MDASSIFNSLSQKVTEKPQFVEDWLTHYHITSIKNYFLGQDTLESAQAAWRILVAEGYNTTELSKKIGEPLKALYSMEGTL
ncbi:hypothetical protein [Vibrio aquimaris]|uniref:Uncharacterized protein n=1 Tax=Vibrio aquimaris TaxID=2587862 RepID=A0A5P9CS94_9VIBR|nr:hypothetical protein [Vibrio aquimaris]QFT28823.1 hypothetical protein FIV01_20690 [Vibrio aquimaris]